MSDYLRVSVISKQGESEGDFKSRLSEFWTTMLRSYKNDFEKVYAETVKFEEDNGHWVREYLFEAEIADMLEREMNAAGLQHEPLDRDAIYTKYEAAPPDWMWIEH